MGERAVVLFHGINVRERESGISKFFLELSQQYEGRTFSFLHSDGLGMLLVGDKVPDILQHFCHLGDGDIAYVRLAFSAFGKFVKAQAAESMLRSKLDELDSANRQMVIDRRKMEAESCKYEIQLASALRERDRQIEEVHRAKEILMRSLSMRLTKPLRDLNDLVRRLR